LTFTKPIAFSDGEERSRFTYEGGARLRADDGTLLRISRRDQREYRIV
jgi:hypothetical protein